MHNDSNMQCNMSHDALHKPMPKAMKNVSLKSPEYFKIKT